MPFDSLGLSPALLNALQGLGHTDPTAIQEAVIPAVLAGRDVLAAAPTGSGKTAAYALPILQQLHAGPRERPRKTAALVLVPTRELAVQAAETFRSLAVNLSEPVKTVAVFGGVSVNPQMMALRGGADIVVATPGRLLDLLANNALVLDRLDVLVLDEADRLLDAGFADELERVLAKLPAGRQTLLLSATFPAAVTALAQALLSDPVRAATPVTTDAHPAIAQRAISVDGTRRTALLRHLIETEAWSRVLVFVATRYASEHVADKLRRHGIAAAAFHGDMEQRTRTLTLTDFKAGRLQVLVATDLAARGIDVIDLPVVVNHDLPRSAVTHLHRIGRTGRAGASGLAVSFIRAEHANDEAHFRLIEKRQEQRVQRERVAGFEPLTPESGSAATAPSPGGVKGRRKSKKDKLRESAALVMGGLPDAKA